MLCRLSREELSEALTVVSQVCKAEYHCDAGSPKQNQYLKTVNM